MKKAFLFWLTFAAWGPGCVELRANPASANYAAALNRLRAEGGGVRHDGPRSTKRPSIYIAPARISAAGTTIDGVPIENYGASAEFCYTNPQTGEKVCSAESVISPCRSSSIVGAYYDKNEKGETVVCAGEGRCKTIEELCRSAESPKSSAWLDLAAILAALLALGVFFWWVRSRDE